MKRMDCKNSMQKSLELVAHLGSIRFFGIDIMVTFKELKNQRRNNLKV